MQKRSLPALVLAGWASLILLPTTSQPGICRLEGVTSRHVAAEIVQVVELGPSVDEVWLRVPVAQNHYAQLHSQTGAQTARFYQPDCCWLEHDGGYYLWAGCQVPPGTDSVKMVVRYEADASAALTQISGGIAPCPGCSWTGPTLNCQSDDPEILNLGSWALADPSPGWGASNWDIMEKIADRVKDEVE
jgi:hypothetical protein